MAPLLDDDPFTASPELIRAIVEAESSGRRNPTSPKGARGLMQIMPGTARDMGVNPADLSNPFVNEEAGTKYFNQLLKQFAGNKTKALEAYNTGPGRVTSGRVPKESQSYASRILGMVGEGTANAAETDAPPGWDQLKPMALPPPGAKPPGWDKLAPQKPPPDSAAGWGGLFKEGVRELDQGLAGPATGMVAKGIGAVEKPLGLDKYVSPETLAQMAVPQNITQLALANFAPLLPEAGWAKRAAMMGGIGGATGAATGEGTTSGALQGATSEMLAAAPAALLKWGSRKAGELPLIQKGTQTILSKIRQVFPASRQLGIKGAQDVEDQFVSGAATEKFAGKLDALNTDIEQKFAKVHKAALDNAVNQLAQGKGSLPLNVKGGMFDVRTPEGVRRLPFREVNDLITEVNRSGYNFVGDPRRTIQGPEARQIGYDMRDDVARQLNKFREGLGDKWLRARKDVTAAETFRNIFSREKGGIVNGQFNQKRIAELLEKGKEVGYYDDLVRSLGATPEAGRAQVKALLKEVRRGAPPGSYDIPSQPGHPEWRMHGFPPIIPMRHMVGKTPFRPAVGSRVPWTMNPPRVPFSEGAQRLVDAPIQWATGQGPPEDENQ